MADKVVMIACGGARHVGREWLGLAALWDLVWDLSLHDVETTPTYRLAMQALQVVSEDSDPALAWRVVQLDQLDAWRAGADAAAPLYWAGIAAVGFST